MYTSHLRIVLGILSGNRLEYVDEPTEMTSELRDVRNHPAVAQMTKYSFIGSKDTVKDQVRNFLDTTQVDELIISSTMYDITDRLKSTELFADIMREINAGE